MIDEALDCFEIYGGLPPKQLTYLQKAGFIRIEEDTGRIDWTEGEFGLPDEGHRFEDVRRLCQSGSLYWMSDKVIVWEFPQAALEQFSSIIVLTYLFEGSTLAPYLRVNGFPYQVKGIDPATGQIKDREQVSETFWKAPVRENLLLHRGTKNKPGAFREPGKPKGSQKFTKTHLTNSMTADQVTKVKNAVSLFLRRKAGVDADKVGWITFEAFRDALKGPRYSDPRAFIPVNMRASNAYRDREAMVYLANMFSNPALRKWIEAKGDTIDEDLFALSEMLQWIWRGCIRDNKPMHLLVPSERMRTLLEAWLIADTLPELREVIASRMGRRTRAKAA